MSTLYLLSNQGKQAVVWASGQTIQAKGLNALEFHSAKSAVASLMKSDEDLSITFTDGKSLMLAGVFAGSSQIDHIAFSDGKLSTAEMMPYHFQGLPLTVARAGALYGYFFELPHEEAGKISVHLNTIPGETPTWLSLQSLGDGKYFLTGIPGQKDTGRFSIRIETNMKGIEQILLKNVMTFTLTVKPSVEPKRDMKDVVKDSEVETRGLSQSEMTLGHNMMIDMTQSNALTMFAAASTLTALSASSYGQNLLSSFDASNLSSSLSGLFDEDREGKWLNPGVANQVVANETKPAGSELNTGDVFSKNIMDVESPVGKSSQDLITDGLQAGSDDVGSGKINSSNGPSNVIIVKSVTPPAIPVTPTPASPPSDEHDDEQGHDQNHDHDQDHDQNHEHDQDHDQNHEHDQDHDQNHEHDQDHNHDQDHDQNHEHDQDHNHDQNHDHDQHHDDDSQEQWHDRDRSDDRSHDQDREARHHQGKMCSDSREVLFSDENHQKLYIFEGQDKTLAGFDYDTFGYSNTTGSIKIYLPSAVIFEMFNKSQNIEQMMEKSHHDLMRGDHALDILYGGAHHHAGEGHDQFSGGADMLNGGTDHDILHFDLHEPIVHGGDGKNSVHLMGRQELVTLDGLKLFDNEAPDLANQNHHLLFDHIPATHAADTDHMSTMAGGRFHGNESADANWALSGSVGFHNWAHNEALLHFEQHVHVHII